MISRTKAAQIACRALSTAANGVHLSPADYLDAAWGHLSDRSRATIEVELDALAKDLDPNDAPIGGERWRNV
jgi:hypothetical protein